MNLPVSRRDFLRTAALATGAAAAARVTAQEPEVPRRVRLETVRTREFPWAERGERVFLSHASAGPIPLRTVKTLEEWARLRAEPWAANDRMEHVHQEARALCGRLIGASSAEIALVPNTSFGLNLAARSLPLEKGDVVLACDGEFPSVVYSWRAVEEARSITLKLIPKRNGLPDEEGLLAALDEPRVRAVTVSWVGFATGYKMDLERLGRECRKRGIFLVVDAIQGLGPSTFDAARCHADIVACGGFKWLLAPWGIAFVYVRKELIPLLTPPVVGWFIGPKSEDYTRLLDYDLRYYEDARRFELVTLPTQDIAGLVSSLGLLFELGLPEIEAKVTALADRLVRWSQERDSLRLVTPSEPSKRASIICIAPPNPAAVSARLRSARIHHALREGAIRLSPYFYNSPEDLDAALSVDWKS